MKSAVRFGALAAAGVFVVEGCLGITGDFNFDGPPVGAGGTGGSADAGAPDAPSTDCPAGDFWDSAASHCQAWTACTAGEQIATLGSKTTDQTCKPCDSGTFSATSNAMTCAPWTPCAAGQYVDQAGTATADEVCGPCPSGQFSAAQNTAAQCTAWSNCQPGTYVSAAGTSTSDCVCTTCPSGTLSTVANQSSCLPVGACAAGTVQTAPATGTMPAVCAPCQPGNYCAGGTAAEVPCGAGTWDNDGDAATACVSWTQCGVGTYVSTPGSTTADQACSKCASGGFTSTSNAASCTPWTACTPGEQIATLGSTTTDQTCQACVPGDFSATSNATSCAAWTTCSPGQYVSQAGTASADRVCTACPVGQTTTTSNASVCNTQYGVLNQSCVGLGTCRGSLGELCCQPLTVPGGTFTQGNNASLPEDAPAHMATVSGYQLEEFEVTVARFRKFVSAYIDNTTANAPPVGAGANPNIPGTGWTAAWTALLPASQAALVADLSCASGTQSWTATPGANEDFPINCVSWYEAFAFCIWDGERLPTESEWEYATAGGNREFPYPWGSTPALSCSYANYQGCLGVVRGVGLASQDDSAQWNQYDLLGNVAEWNFDSETGYPSAAVTNYAYSYGSTTNDTRVFRGGGINEPASYVNATSRRYTAPTFRSSDIGVRCAH